MSRFLVVASVVFLAACGPADSMNAAGRCTADAQCPAGASCDTKLGVCVTGTPASSAKPLPSEYGKYCENDSHCAGIAGTTCNYYQCTFSCAKGETCQSGTTCGGSYYPGCFQNCSQSSDCRNGSMCGVMKLSGGAEFSACYPKWPSDLGGTCKDDLGCGEDFKCVVTSSRPNGYCTKSCTKNADCYAGGLCVTAPGASAGICSPKCDSPGTASTCVPGTSCRALSTASYGYCF